MNSLRRIRVVVRVPDRPLDMYGLIRVTRGSGKSGLQVLRILTPFSDDMLLFC